MRIETSTPLRGIRPCGSPELHEHVLVRELPFTARMPPGPIVSSEPGAGLKLVPAKTHATSVYDVAEFREPIQGVFRHSIGARARDGGLRCDFDPKDVTRNYLPGPILYFIAFVLSFVAPLASVILIALINVFYAVSPLLSHWFGTHRQGAVEPDTAARTG